MTVHAHSIGSTVPCGWHASTWRRLCPSPGLLARLRDQRRCRAGYYAATTVRAAAAGVEQGPAGGESSAAPEEAPTQFVEVGVVGPPHGVRGEFKVQPLTDFPEDRLGTPGLRWLRAPAPKLGRRQAPPPVEVELEWGRSSVFKGNEVWIVKLEGVESPEEAATLRGHTLLIPASARGALEDEDEFYVQDLVGLRVFMASSGEELGRVVDIFDGTGAHDVLRIELLEQAAEAEADGRKAGEGRKYVLLPFAKALVPTVDVAAGRMEIVPPEGLLELATSGTPKRERRESRGQRERRGGRREKGQGAGGEGAGSSAEES